MASTEKDWTASTPVADTLAGLSQPSVTRRWADGTATTWCKHKAPGCYRAVLVRNRGTGVAYVSTGPALSGAAASTDHAARLQANEAQLFNLTGGTDGYTYFSTWGVDGATHEFDLTFELSA